MLKHELEPESQTAAMPAHGAQIDALSAGEGVKAAYWRRNPYFIVTPARALSIVLILAVFGGISFLLAQIRQISSAFFWMWFAPFSQMGGGGVTRFLRWARSRLRRRSGAYNCSVQFRLNYMDIGEDEGDLIFRNGQLVFEGGATSFALARNERVSIKQQSVKDDKAGAQQLNIHYADWNYQITITPFKPDARQSLAESREAFRQADPKTECILPPLWVHDQNWMDRDRIYRHWRTAGIGTVLAVAASIFVSGFVLAALVCIIAAWLGLATYLWYGYQKKIKRQQEIDLMPQSAIEQQLIHSPQDDIMPGIIHNRS